MLQRRVEALAADVVPVYVDRALACKDVRGLLLLVVEHNVRADALHEGALLVGTRACDDLESVGLRKPHDEGSNGARRGGDENNIARLHARVLLPSGPRGLAGHARNAEVHGPRQPFFVLEDTKSIEAVEARKDGVLHES